jgi:hypothetical protein
MKNQLVIAFVAMISGACGSSAAGGLCVEGVCFALPTDVTMRRTPGRASLFVPRTTGWINVQRFTPIENPPTDADEQMSAFSARLALSPSSRVLWSRRANVLGTVSSVHELEVASGGRAMRRRIWLIPPTVGSQWTTVDITASDSDFNSAVETLEPIVFRATRRASNEPR